MKSMKKLYRVLLLCMCFAMAVPITGIAATNSVSIMYIGSKKTERKMTVKTSKKKIVSVKKNGKKTIITPKAVGEATLKYYKGKKLKKKVSVLVLKKNSVSYNTGNLAVKPGKSKTVKAIAPKKCKITYSSSNKKIATVNSKGVIKGVKAGSCTIVVKVTYKGKMVKAFKKKVTVSKNVSESNTYGGTTGGKGGKSSSGSSSIRSSSNSSSASGSSASGSSASGSSANIISIKNITASCTKTSVKEGYHFTLDDFIVYGNYSDGSRKRIYNFRITTSYASSNGYYEISIDAQGFVVKVRVPVSANGPGGEYDPSQDNPPSQAKAIDIEVHFAKTEIDEDYTFPMSDFTVYTLYSDGTKKLAAGFGFQTSYKDGYYYITVTSGNFSKVLKVKAASSVTESTVTSVKFLLTSNVVKVGENLAPDQIQVTAYHSDGKEENVTDFKHDFTPKSTPGQYPINITWKSYTKTMTINVVANEPALQTADINFARQFLYLDETPTKDDIIVTGHYSDGGTKRVTDFTFTFTPAKGHGQNALLTVTVKGKSKDLMIPCYDRKIPVGIDATINNARVRVNQSIDPSIIVLVATYRDGHKAIETDFTLDFTPKSEPGSYPVVLTFRGMTLDFMVEVVE